MHTRKCHVDVNASADANVNADENGIWTENSIPP